MPGVLKRLLVKKLGIVINPFGQEAEDGPPHGAVPFHSAHAALPGAVDLRKHCSEVEAQTGTNSCCANAVVGALEYLSRRAGCSGDLSRLFVYYNARVKAGKVPLKDDGSSITYSFVGLKELGVCTEETWPFDKKLVNQKPSPQAFEEAQQFKVTETVTMPLKEHDMKECLATGYPFIFGLKLTQKFMNPGPKGIIYTPDPSDPQAAEHGSHVMLGVGYSDKQKVFIVRNSWGANWGDKGYCYIPYAYMCNAKYSTSGGNVFAVHAMSCIDFAMEMEAGAEEDVVDWDENEEIDDEVEECEEEEEEEAEQEDGAEEGGDGGEE